MGINNVLSAQRLSHQFVYMHRYLSLSLSFLTQSSLRDSSKLADLLDFSWTLHSSLTQLYLKRASGDCGRSAGLPPRVSCHRYAGCQSRSRWLIQGSGTAANCLSSPDSSALAGSPGFISALLPELASFL